MEVLGKETGYSDGIFVKGLIRSDIIYDLELSYSLAMKRIG